MSDWEIRNIGQLDTTDLPWTECQRLNTLHRIVMFPSNRSSLFICLLESPLVLFIVDEDAMVTFWCNVNWEYAETKCARCQHTRYRYARTVPGTRYRTRTRSTVRYSLGTRTGTVGRTILRQVRDLRRNERMSRSIRGCSLLHIALSQLSSKQSWYSAETFHNENAWLIPNSIVVTDDDLIETNSSSSRAFCEFRNGRSYSMTWSGHKRFYPLFSGPDYPFHGYLMT
jgi:hypothetical protein